MLFRSRQTNDAAHALLEPVLQPLPALSGWQQMDAKADLAEDDGVNDQFALVALQPFHHAARRFRLGRLAEDVGVDQEIHKLSVDSDSIATKNPFSGQASNQSTKPSFGRGWRRTDTLLPAVAEMLGFQQ